MRAKCAPNIVNVKHSPCIVDHVKRKKPTTAALTTNSTTNLKNAVNLKENGCLTGINKMIRANESLSSFKSFRQMNILVQQPIIICDHCLSFARFQIDLKAKHCQKFVENNLCIPCIQLIAFCWNGNENVNLVIVYCLIHIDSNHCRKIAIPLIFLTCNRNERAFQHLNANLWFSEFDNESNDCVWLYIRLSLILFTNCIYFEPKHLEYCCSNGNSKRLHVITFLKRLLSFTSAVSPTKYSENNVNYVCQIAKIIFDLPQPVCSTTPNRINSVASSKLLATSVTRVESLLIYVSIQLIYTVFKMKFNSVITATSATPIITSTNDDNIDIETSILNSSMPSLNHMIVSLCHIQRSLLNKRIKQCQCSDHQRYDTIIAPYTDQTNHKYNIALNLLSLPLSLQMTTASPLPLLSLLSLSYICNFVTRYKSTLDLFLTNKINTNNNYINNEKATTTTNPDQKRCDNDLENCGKCSIITKGRHRQRSLSKRIFITLTSLHIDIRKMFISVLIPLMLFCNMLPISCAECDQTFVSRPGGPQNGTFTAPIISIPLNNPSNHSRQCLYIFLAGPGQRVEIVFTSFNLRGSPPDGAAVGEIPSCGTEYMDIYSEVQSSDPADLINSPFGGRYCGVNLPRRRISLYRAIALSFFTNKNASSADLFTGRFSFINASIFEIGKPITGSPCSFSITPQKNKSDVFISPTYPGSYPKDLLCTYNFSGESNQRVRLEFRDFDLFFGGPHCPFDYVKVYDGPDNSSELIGTYCGQQRNLVLYSSESNLLVHFFTLRRTASTQNRGFKGIYEFSESFVKLDFIREHNGMHIRGTECDQKILSKRESSGIVYSPNYPFPYLPKTVCRYFIYGLQDAQHLERVRLEFQMFEVQKGEHKDKDKETNCTDGYLKLFLKGQETQDAYDKFDYELCGMDLPHPVVSDGPRLAMVFSSGELLARGFKAKYTFETEYKIPGTAAPDGSCSFTYRSTSRKKGEFNSPRFPSKYISGTNCSYKFLATPNEQVTILFDHFKVKADNANTTNGYYGSLACSEDWLEIFVLFRGGSERFLGRYCGVTAPGPVESPSGAIGVRIHLHTDDENVSSGFKGRYVFEVAKSVTGDCGGNYSGQESDVITSPNYPGKYDGPGKGLASRACNWYINSRPGFRVSMSLEFFSVEGDPLTRGCPAATLRIWAIPDAMDQAPIELCGDELPADARHYISHGQNARISFITTDKTIGAQGFRIVWTEVQDVSQLPGSASNIAHHCEPAYLFHCANSGYCISNKLRCDGLKNCGPNDESDELNCITEVTKDESEILIISSLVAGSFLICLVCTIYHRRKRRKHHHRQLGLHRSGGHYDSTTSATGLGSSRRHLQSGNSLSGSLHYGINSDDDILPIPQPPLPPANVPRHLNHLMISCTEDMIDPDSDEEEEEEEIDLEN